VQLVKPDDAEYIAFMRRMADKRPSRGGPRAAGEYLGGLVELLRPALARQNRAVAGGAHSILGATASQRTERHALPRTRCGLGH